MYDSTYRLTKLWQRTKETQMWPFISATVCNRIMTVSPLPLSSGLTKIFLMGIDLSRFNCSTHILTIQLAWPRCPAIRLNEHPEFCGLNSGFLWNCQLFELYRMLYWLLIDVRNRRTTFMLVLKRCANALLRYCFQPAVHGCNKKYLC